MVHPQPVADALEQVRFAEAAAPVEEQRVTGVGIVLRQVAGRGESQLVARTHDKLFQSMPQPSHWHHTVGLARLGRSPGLVADGRRRGVTGRGGKSLRIHLQVQRYVRPELRGRRVAQVLAEVALDTLRHEAIGHSYAEGVALVVVVQSGGPVEPHRVTAGSDRLGQAMRDARTDTPLGSGRGHDHYLKIDPFPHHAGKRGRWVGKIWRHRHAG